MIAMYGVANLLQAIAASRVTIHHTLDPSLLLKLASHKTYVIGLGCQLTGYILAVFARRDLPLFLVQASVAAGLGVTAVLGVLVLKWRLPRAEVALLGMLIIGVTALVLSAHPGPPRKASATILAGLVAALVLVAVAGFFVVRIQGPPGAVALGGVAGVAFGAAAVASRPLANLDDLSGVFSDPLLYLLIAHSIVGQLLFGLALQRGSTTAAVASMDAAFAVPPAAVGLLLLGDRIEPGREWLAAVGFTVTLASVVGLTRYAEPQYHHRAREPAPVLVSSGRRRRV
ncbi:MAG: hypothetical protein GEU94_07825 [Micromonosporaceae bacterium]|nr:hypothetical protein [Micromonosporaceae bacterium]